MVSLMTMRCEMGWLDRYSALSITCACMSLEGEDYLEEDIADYS